MISPLQWRYGKFKIDVNVEPSWIGFSKTKIRILEELCADRRLFFRANNGLLARLSRTATATILLVTFIYQRKEGIDMENESSSTIASGVEVSSSAEDDAPDRVRT